jgi:hypothetical protein
MASREYASLNYEQKWFGEMRGLTQVAEKEADIAQENNF